MGRGAHMPPLANVVIMDRVLVLALLGSLLVSCPPRGLFVREASATEYLYARRTKSAGVVASDWPPPPVTVRRWVFVDCQPVYQLLTASRARTMSERLLRTWHRGTSAQPLQRVSRRDQGAIVRSCARAVAETSCCRRMAVQQPCPTARMCQWYHFHDGVISRTAPRQGLRVARARPARRKDGAVGVLGALYSYLYLYGELGRPIASYIWFNPSL